MSLFLSFFFFISSLAWADNASPLGRISTGQTDFTFGCAFFKKGEANPLLIADYGSSAFAVVNGKTLDLTLTFSNEMKAKKKDDALSVKYARDEVTFAYAGSLITPFEFEGPLREISSGKLEFRQKGFSEAHDVIQRCGKLKGQ